MLSKIGATLVKDADVIIKYIVAIAVVYSFIQIVYTINHRIIPKENEQLFTHLVGIVEGAFVGSLTAYYWTRNSPTKKEETHE